MSRAHDNSTVHPEDQANQACFEDVYNRYRHNIYNYIAIKVNPGAAEDLTQQVFLKAMENLQSFHGKSGLFTWLFKIAQNTVKNEFRSLSRKKELLYDLTERNAR